MVIRAMHGELRIVHNIFAKRKYADRLFRFKGEMHALSMMSICAGSGSIGMFITSKFLHIGLVLYWTWSTKYVKKSTGRGVTVRSENAPDRPRLVT